MKNKFNLIEWLWKTDSHEKQKMRSMWRYAAMLLMLLTLGVGQMWAGAGLYEVYFEYSYNGNNSSATYTSSTSSTQTIALGTLTADFKIKSMYPKVWKEGSGNICGCLVEYYIDSDKEKTGFSYDKSLGGNNHQWKNTTSWTVASYNSGASGSYTFWYRFKAWGSSSSSSSCSDNTYYIPTGGVKNKFTYNIAPPAISSFSVSESGYLSGSGTSGDPYIIPYNGTLTLTVSGSKGRTDANSTIKYWKNSGDKQNSNVLTVTGITSTTKTSVVVHAQCINNSSSSLVGTESTKTVWYKSEAAYNVTAASGGHGTVTPTSATKMGTTSGGNITASPSTGYNFGSWAITSGSGYFGESGTATTSTTANTKFRPSAATTVTATFTAKTYSITLHDNNGGSNNGSATATYDGGLSSLSAPTRSSYHVVGYYKEAELTNLIADEEGNLEASTDYTDESGNWTNDGAVTLYAKWAEDASYYTLTYGAGSSPYNNGSVSAVNASTSAAISSGASLLSGTSVTFTATPTNSHYKLKGWYSDAACGSAIAGAGTTNPYTKTINATQSVYAGFEIKTCTITLDRNGGTSGSTAVTATHGSTLPSFTAHGLSGYTLQGYYTETSGGTKIINADGSLVASTSYANGSKQWNSDVTSLTLHAQWTENMTTVTVNVSPASSGTLTVGGGAFTPGNTTTAGVATSRTVVATAQPGYRFTGWTATNCNVASTSSASTTLSGNGTTGDATLVANFARTYAYLEGRMTVYNAARTSETHTASSKGGWDESSTRIEMEYDETNHRFYRHTYKTPAELKAQISSQDQWFSVKTGTVHNSFASGTVKAYHPSSNTNIATAGTKYSAPTTSTTYNFKFTNTATDGYAIIYFDEAGVWYELEQSLKYDANGGSGDAPTPTYYLRGTNATAASNPFTARKNYTFAGWNTAADITGTSYAAGASVPMSADRILYAKWNRSVTLDQQDATTPGSTSVTATWNCSTLPSITNPQKLGYEFGGWYTETAGNGNIIINTSGQLQANKTNWTVSGGKFQRTPSSDASESKPLYAKWTQTVTLNANTDHHGSAGGTATIVYNATAKSSITHCTPATGYQLEGYYTAATGGTKILAANGDFAGSDITVDAVPYTSGGAWVKAGNTTLYAHYTPKTYSVILDVNGATTGSNQTVTATFDAAMPTVCSDGTTPLAAPSKTGYTFGGYWTNNAGTGTQYYTNALASNHIWDVATNNTHIYAKWTAKTTNITLDQTGAATTGSVTTRTGTYDAAMPAISGANTLPVAPQGYAFMGYYDALEPLGNKYYNSDGTSARTWNKEDATATLYAYYKKAEITNLVAAPGVIAPGETITITPTIEPTPTGTTKVCYEVQYSNGTPLPSQPTFTPGVGNAVSFPVPSASATYIIQAKLAKGSTCPANPEDVLSTRTTTFQVAGEHDVAVRYQDSEGRTLASSIEVTGKPLEWSDPITAPTITGYTFHHWLAGDGITLSEDGSTAKTGVRPDSSLVSSVYIQAVYDGTLTAVYNKKNMIYFNNTLGWEDVWVYFYTSDKYWADNWGTGAWRGQYFTGDRPYYNMHRGHMTQIEGTNIWYFDYTANGWDGWENVAFTNMGDQTGQGASADAQAPDNDHAYFSNTIANPIQVVRRGDHKTTLPMFVPLTGQTGTLLNNNKANYVNQGYWMNYPENTGYVLHVYNGTTYGTADQLQVIPFEFSADKTLPMSINVELNAGKTYGFEIHRADNTVLGENSYTLKNGDSGETGQTVRTLGTGERSKITTTVAGDYKFTLNYGNSGGYNYLIGVHYPVTIGDYRILYTDDATWSKGAHTANYSWWHESRTIHKEDGAEDIVSFYVKKDEDTEMKFQYANSITAGTGVVDWRDVASGDINLSSITEDGVYNFYLTQADGGISVSKIEPYNGTYYIRTDCAGNTKWENFRTLDHQMTYSDYTDANEGYSHYFAHWVRQYTNIKFVIANDYSPCISDTLAADYGPNPIANITTSGVEAGKLNSAGANIRFMWNQATNKISRAYIGGSGDITDRFLVLEGDARMYDENGTALTGVNRDHITYDKGLPSEETKYLTEDHQVILHDDENFIYERTIQVNTTARAKLTAAYNDTVQYFKGDEGAFADGTTVQLLGGEASATKHKMRIVYDFKTNRLVTAYVPSDTIKNSLAINADLMIVREHQEAGKQLIFKGDGALSAVKTVYGVMRFNRWTLNNKEKTGGHGIVGDPKSAYERGLYWISFPFDVNLSDVFGFGTYGTHWIIEEYDGTKRAKDGYWADSKSFWGYVMPSQRPTFVLKAGKGYVLALDLDLMKDNNTTFWTNNIEQVELFFPSASFVEEIEATDVTTSADSHLYDAAAHPGHTDDRTYKDSHWNMIGVPSYANYGETLTSDGSTVITWQTPTNADLPYLYEWNMVDDTYTPQTGTTYPFKSMHAYMVQYNGEMHWSLASATPQTLAPRRNSDALRSVEFKLELQQNDKMTDQTFVKLSNEENIHAGFAFDEDLSKEFNKRKANIYTIVENNTPVAGNTLPMTEQTTVIPVGVKIVADGEYTFAIPEGTNGTGVTLIDTYTGVSTPLGLTSYTVDLEAGTYDSRFVLEISPVKQTPTDIESTDVSHQNSAVRKVLIDNMLYIVKDGEVFDARGAKVK